jgi:hypothetical protein
VAIFSHTGNLWEKRKNTFLTLDLLSMDCPLEPQFYYPLYKLRDFFLRNKQTINHGEKNMFYVHDWFKTFYDSGTVTKPLVS